MAFVFLRAAQRVEWSGAYQRINVELLRALDLLDNALGFHIDNAHQNRHAMINNAHGVFQHFVALIIIQEGHFST